MKSCILLALLAGCPTSKSDDTASVTDPADTDTDTDTDTEVDTTDDAGEDWDGGCEYTASALGADEPVDSLGGTPSEFVANVSGARSNTFHWDAENTDTPLAHTLTLDVATATLWVGEWIDDDTEDTGETLADETDGGDSTSGGGGDTTATTTDSDTDATGTTDTTTDSDTDATDTTDTTDTDTDTDWGDCPEYMTVEGDWSFTTEDGAFAEELYVTVRAGSLEVGRIDHDLDYAELVGTWVPYDIVPDEWDELRVSWAANIGSASDVGEVALFGSRETGDTTTDTTDTTTGDDSTSTGDDGTSTDGGTSTDDGTSTGVAEGFMADMGRWPAP